MSKNFVRNTVILTTLVVVLVGSQVLPQSQKTSSQTVSTPSVVIEKQTSTTVSYVGREGIDALSLLRERVPVEQDDSGMVSAINGRKADSNKHEYWAFYVNGSMAPVGAHEYISKDTDKIEWKIETY